MSLESKMLGLAKLARKRNNLQIKSISKERFEQEIKEIDKEYITVTKEIYTEINEIQHKLELAKTFFEIVDMEHGREPWYKMKEYVKERSKYVPRVVYDYVKKIIDKEEAERKRIDAILARYK